MFFLTAEVSFSTVNVTASVVTLLAVKVTPATVSANALVAELTAMPFTVALALRAYSVVIPVDRRDRPAPSARLPSASATLSWNPAASPVVLLRSSSRSPDASFNTVAVTPALDPLILLATSASVSVALISRLTASPLPAVNALGSPAQVPVASVSVPAPTGCLVGCNAADMDDWAIARFCTCTLKDVTAAPPTALTDTASALEEVALTPFHPVTLVSLLAASASVDTSDLNWPKVDTLALVSAACCCRPLVFVMGSLTASTDALISPLTSTLPPRPIPIEEKLAMTISVCMQTGMRAGNARNYQAEGPCASR